MCLLLFPSQADGVLVALEGGDSSQPAGVVLNSVGISGDAPRTLKQLLGPASFGRH
ncbi:hypothetical protein EYF80_062712 [Liparis tanakae]|uniref:Uncharacterized protein n=1 Tax=Liparis tanakae TaxID=230148 RepID=A0A4Z2EEG7_9TELE|nr:hypothetical protein EYF80_062712 [Liparis tanakae]